VAGAPTALAAEPVGPTYLRQRLAALLLAAIAIEKEHQTQVMASFRLRTSFGVQRDATAFERGQLSH